MKYGLVLSGGGARGAYQVGVIKALIELGFKFDIVTGTSVGALNAILLVADKFETLTNIWKNIDYNSIVNHTYTYKNKTLEMFINTILKKRFSIAPLEKLIRENVNENEIRTSNIKGGLVYTEENFEMKELTFDEIPQNEIIDYLIASCSAYPFFEKRKIKDKLCFDGYYTDNMPINLAIEMGAEKIIAINVMNGFKKKIKNKEIKILELKRKRRMHFFLNFDNKKINKSIKYGYIDTMRKKDKILKFITNN